MRLVVFDLDGTLVDSRRDLADAANALIVEHGGAPLDVDRVAGMVGEGAALLVRRALAAAGVERNDFGAALTRFLELYDERLLVHTRLYEGTGQFDFVYGNIIPPPSGVSSSVGVQNGAGAFTSFECFVGGSLSSGLLITWQPRRLAGLHTRPRRRARQPARL